MFYCKVFFVYFVEFIYVFIYLIVNGKSMERWLEKDSLYLLFFDNGNYVKVICMLFVIRCVVKE